MSVDKLVKKALDRIGDVHPTVKKGAELVIRRAYKQGIYVLFSDGYRSYVEQNLLYAQGRTTPGNIVTNARGGQSYHNFGLALDMYITDKDGTTAKWDNQVFRKVAYSIAKPLGFEWGGDWSSFRDYPHLQMSGGLSLSQLRNGTKPKLSINVGNGKVDSATSKPQVEHTEPQNYTQDAKWPKLYNEGKNVKSWQKRLIKLGYNIKADGSFGPATDKATRQFQSKQGLSIDGQAGPSSQSKADQMIDDMYYVDADGYWGRATTIALQRHFGTTDDGVISGQYHCQVNNNIESVQFGPAYTGSNVIRSLQRYLNVDADGFMGKGTLKALQRRLGTTADGYLSRPSNVVKELQRRLNSNSL